MQEEAGNAQQDMDGGGAGGHGRRGAADVMGLGYEGAKIAAAIARGYLTPSVMSPASPASEVLRV